MTITKAETKRMLADLHRELTPKLKCWTRPSGVESDEIIAESIEALWVAKKLRYKKITTPIRWLLSTARRLMLEKSRSVRAYRIKPLTDSSADSQNKCRSESLAIADSPALLALGLRGSLRLPKC